MNVVPESNPQIRALAREAAEQIKTLSEAHNAEIQTIYQDFRSQADAIRASGDELHTRTADSSQTTELSQSQGLTTLCRNQIYPQPNKP